jgi:uncharacterized protein
MPRSPLVAASLAAVAFALAGAPSRDAAAQPSFDCTKATSSVEITICSDPSLSALDVRMAQLYQRARRNPRVDRKALLASQREWWKFRESQCGRSRRAAECLIDVYNTRIDELMPLSY